MKVGKHTAFMIDFVSDFADGNMSRNSFELDYSGYCIEHFPKMERENARLARKFANTVDVAFEYAENHSISDDDFRVRMNNALCDFFEPGDPTLF